MPQRRHGAAHGRREDPSISSLEGTDLTGFEIVDLKGGYLMPGLINLHVHLPSERQPPKAGQSPQARKIHDVHGASRGALWPCEGYAKTQLSGVDDDPHRRRHCGHDTRSRGRTRG